MRWVRTINKCRASCPKVNRLTLSSYKPSNELSMMEKQAAAKHVNETKVYTSSHYNAVLQPHYYCHIISSPVTFSLNI